MSRRRDKKRFSKPNRVPTGAVVANVREQVPNNSYDPPPQWYVDKPFKCVDCGSEEVWTAEQQKWFYEVAKGSLYATAKRCRQCRHRIRDAKDENRRKSEAGRKMEGERPSVDGT